jgi:hypothetical protein
MSENENVQITISDRADEICETMVNLKFFEDKKDVYVAAICLAIALDLELDPTIKMPLNRWHTASVFHGVGRSLSSLMILLGFREDEIVSKGKLLAEAGLRYIEEKRLSQSDLVDVLLNSTED